MVISQEIYISMYFYFYISSSFVVSTVQTEIFIKIHVLNKIHGYYFVFNIQILHLVQ